MTFRYILLIFLVYTPLQAGEPLSFSQAKKQLDCKQALILLILLNDGVPG
jgi:hypothetical protein